MLEWWQRSGGAPTSRHWHHTRHRALLLAGISIGLAGAVLVLMIVVDWPHF
jgi:uncharacterized iron-regulated membrane protein